MSHRSGECGGRLDVGVFARGADFQEEVLHSPWAEDDDTLSGQGADVASGMDDISRHVSDLASSEL